MYERKYAPWNLSGDGYILLYKLPKDFLIENSFISPNFKEIFYGGFSALIIVDYKKSNVGAYKEILFIPGLFKFQDKKHFSISKIYVDSESSIYNGVENWGIPKEYSDFKIKNMDKYNDSIEIFKNNIEFFKADIKTKNNFLKLPFSSKLLKLSLLQQKNSEFYITDFFATGAITMIDIKINHIDQNYFPDIKPFKPLISLKISNFNMSFKEAKIFH